MFYVQKSISAAYFVVVILTTNTDIGHVDFLEMVYKQAEKPYVIVGLHFDQVRYICIEMWLWWVMK